MNPSYSAPRAWLAVAFALAAGGQPIRSVAGPADEAMPDVSVTGVRDEQSRVSIEPVRTPVTLPNTAELLKRTPGANLNYNGPLTGIGQYRGMFAYRVNTRVDGVPVVPGGPNWMDAPLHYAPLPLVDSLELQRGIAPVSAGSETIGGYVQAHRMTSEFSDNAEFALHGRLNGSAQSADDGFGIGGLVAGSNANHRLHALGVVEEGDDMEFANGRILPTEYERRAWGMGYGFRAGGHGVGIDYFRNETGDSGTPALPMDIRYIDTDFISTEYSGDFGGLEFSARLHFHSVEHAMDNFGLRAPPPGAARYRRNLAESDTTGFELASALDLGGGMLNFGIDGDFSAHESDISNPNNTMFFVTNFNGVERDRYGLFAEWATTVGENWSWHLGARYARVDADADTVDGTPAMMMPSAARLRDRFNSADRDLSWTIVDAVAKLSFSVSDTLRLDIGLGHKERAPAYQELYLWLPLQATAGLADGKNYIGNLQLKEEKANVVDVGLDWHSQHFYFGPRVFYKRIDDYIQGTPATDTPAIMFSTMMGSDPAPLQFNNVDAELYGIDADFGVQILPRWRIDGVVSYVRGDRRDIDDNLYRIAPLTSVVGLTYERARWTMVAEGEFAAEQNRVSVTNEETRSAGYGIMNLYGSYRVGESLLLSAGVINAFDKLYRDHTNGVNRVSDSDVAVGERLPGPGRSLFLRANYSW